MTKSPYMTWDDIYTLISNLASSQGFYSRLLQGIDTLEIERPHEYRKFVAKLEALHFVEPIEVIMYFEG